MINYGKQFGYTEPQEIEITGTSVFVASNIQEVSREVEEHQITGYEYDLIQYTKDEYLIQQASHIHSLEEELAAAKILLGVE